MSDITVTISGPVGCGKSAVAGEIEIALKAIGVQVRYEDKDAARSEKRMTGGDWTSYLEMYKPNVVLVEQIDRADTTLKAMEAYALDVTKALTGLAGGGSEMFSGQLGNIYKADIAKCCQVVHDRHAKTHELLIKAVKEKNAAVESREALANKIEDLIAEFGDDPKAALQCVSEYLDLRRHNRNREGNGNG